ncbi:hypothetical protein JCM31739_18500 [Faecalimonas canis]
MRKRKKMGIMGLAMLLCMGVAYMPVNAELSDQNPPNATEETYKPFHPNLEEDDHIIETEEDLKEEEGKEFAEVSVDEEHFPDEDFRNFVSEKFDVNKNRILESDEIRQAKNLDTEYEVTMSSLEGIEYLSNLKRLVVSMAGIKSIDISKNSKLQIVDVNWNEELQVIDVSANKELRILDISNTPINQINVTNNKELRWLFAFDTNISDFDVSQNVKLKRLDIGRTGIKKIDVSHNPKLQALNIEETQVDKVDLSKNRDLYEFYFKDTPISEVDLSKNWNLAQIWASGTKLSHLDVSHCKNLFVLYIQNTAIKEMDFSRCPNLYELFASNSALQKVDLANHTNLNCVEIDGTDVKEIRVDKSKNLQGLSLSGTKVKNLDLSKNTELKRLEVNNTPLRYLDLSHNVNLEKLYFDNTNIENMKKVNAELYPKLQELGCENAGIVELILPKSKELIFLNCAGNHLKELDLSNISELWLGMEVSPQNITVFGKQKGDKLIVDLHEVVSDLNRITVEPSENYVYNKSTGEIIFKNNEEPVFMYQYAHQYSHNSKLKTISVKANVLREYLILEGIGQKVYYGNDISFICNGKKEMIEKCLIDGVELNETEYCLETIEEGKIKITLKKEMLSTLAKGKHCFSVVYKDGEANTTFELADKQIVTPVADEKPFDKTEVKTGDTSNANLWGMLMILSLGLVFIQRKSK